MKKERIHILTMITGVVTAVVVVFSQLFFFQVSNYNKKDIKTEKEQKQQGDDEAAYISLPSLSQQSHSTHVEVIQRSACLFEILFEKKKQISDPIDISISLGKFFHTLFRVIISPNAP